MVDLETLSTDSNAIILTIGAVPFGPDGSQIVDEDSYFYERVDLKSYNRYKDKFSIDYNTLNWWMRQEQEPRDQAFLETPRYSIDTVMQDFVNWLTIMCNAFGDSKINIWSHGKDFDVVVLENAFKICGIGCPWKYFDTRDTRTLYALAGVDSRNISIPEGFKAHNAIGDCLKQIEGVRLSYNNLNGIMAQRSTNNIANNDSGSGITEESVSEPEDIVPNKKRRRSERLANK
jgi:hypothetical protein